MSAEHQDELHDDGGGDECGAHEDREVPLGERVEICAEDPATNAAHSSSRTKYGDEGSGSGDVKLAFVDEEVMHVH
jgi:hypothetical protein